jgi:hypothetical protein
MTTPEDDLFEHEDLVNEWSVYLNNPFVINNCRHFLETLWTRQFGEPT